MASAAPKPQSAKGKPQTRAWQRMLSGRRLDLIEPSPLDIEIEDIAHGLARVSRWNGQTKGAYAFSVAQHSLVVLTAHELLYPQLKPEQRLYSLLHDAPEYVIGDMISPFKSVVGGAYKAIEARLQEAIHLRFALPAKTPASVKRAIKRADTVAAYFEATALAGFSHGEARTYFGMPGDIRLEQLQIEPMPAEEAQAQFLGRFHAIESERQHGKALKT